MGGDGWGLVWLGLVVISTRSTFAICPSRCSCKDDTLEASCVDVGLDVVPIQLNPDVQAIDLHGNKIANVHYTLTFYTRLRQLDVSANRIQSLGAKNFELQGKLVSLNVSYNNITTLGKDAFRGLKSIKFLDLSHNNIKTVEHGSFRDTVDLEVLDLSYNSITSFEDSTIFKSVRSLKVLNFNSNELLDVPSGVLKNLPSPCSLETLLLSYNLIEIIEDKSFPLPCATSLKVVTLSTNVLRDIEKLAFNSLHNLNTLDLSNNNLTFIPTQQLSKLNQLTDLNLSGNMFSDIKPVAFQSLFQLQTLRLSNLPHMNRIDSRAFVDNIKLENIFIERNHLLAKIPARIFYGNQHLLHVHLRGNSLVTLDASHFPLDRLKSLDLSENPLNCNCSLHWLWKLAQAEVTMIDPTASSINDSASDDEANQLRIALNGLRCANPENLYGKLIIEIPESTVRCETTWLTVAIVTAFVLALFGVTCVVLLLFGSERKMCGCRREKQEPDVSVVDTRRLAAGLHAVNGPPPILMLMPDKHYRDAIMHSYMKNEAEMKLVEPWMNGEPQQVDYSVDMTTQKKPHIVYV